MMTTVLLVEDDPAAREGLELALRRLGYGVRCAVTGEAALDGLSAAPADVVLLDVMLPGLDGLEVCRRLRQHSEVPVIMLTARGGDLDIVGGLEAGADDYVVKPFALREVVARVRALTRRHLPDRTSILTAGPIRLDMAAHTLQVAGAPVELTAKEHAILEYFMLNPGLLLTRGQIIEHVWERDFEGSYNLIEVYVGRLRRKLTQAGAPDPILTVRGAGYRFDPPPPCDAIC
jgi:DNA-binding response OmpR family regulator